MSPSNSNAGMELPPPVPEQPPQPEVPSEANQSPAEAPAPAVFEQAPPSGQGAQAAPPPTLIPLPGAPLPLPPSPSATSDDQGSDLPQQDKDLIEKEWVNKAKSIVERTREDPYKQSEDLTMLKADYMKKQFNKTLKINK